MELLMNREDFTTSYPPFNVLNTRDKSSLWTKKPINVYVHIPFCSKRCDFCYYRVEAPKGRDEIQYYVELLLEEIKLMSQLPEFNLYQMNSLYFGGGTPSMLSEEQIVSITEAIVALFPKSKDFEFCMEVSPSGGATKAKLETMKSIGVGRISMGLQSLNEQILELNGRNHSKKQFYQAFERIREAGFDWINCDIMSGMLGTTEENWQGTIQELLGLHPENIAIYKMEVYYNTKLFRKVKEEPALLISNRVEARHFDEARAVFEDHGYRMSDCFSFISDDKYLHRHRRNLQNSEEMIGIGLSSFSYVNGYVYQNTSKMDEYENMIRNHELPMNRAYKLTQQDEMVRFIAMGLKNLHFSRQHFIDRFGVDASDLFANKIEHLIDKEVLYMNDNTLGITSRYYGYADDIGRFFYPKQHQKSMLAHITRED
ncbi:coproporphyrinogen-III oxidase family protein [Paenibacillus polymyxa]|uniref:coproporphyrinogen-III oxidase family protein n=1 Tax=Paenibacillus polymyxa TaxID=1406 RepID=UPI000F9DF24C|nr:coproporphyrinogen III oxidase family protein [Paenibacillus sp. EKM208P]